jgi:glutamate synthase domain-containing protein 3
VSTAAGDGATATLVVPEIRDYTRINAQVRQHLDDGCRRVVLVGVEGQRLLLSGLVGSWAASIELEGDAGPELGAECDVPGVYITVRGSVGDGAGREMRNGWIVVLGSATTCLGYRLRGGFIGVRGDSGPRAGLEQSGGTIVSFGELGDLAGERATGGTLVGLDSRASRRPGFGRAGGLLWLAGIDACDAESGRVDRARAELAACFEAFGGADEKERARRLRLAFDRLGVSE